MKGGITAIPSREQLETAYMQLLHERPASPSEKELALFARWGRFDPRLAEIWITYLSKKWTLHNPVQLRDELLRGPWPAAAAVLLHFARKLTDGESQRVFDCWCRLVTEGIPKVDAEQFFIGLRQIGGKEMFEDARFATREYLEWGFLGRENLVRGKSVTHLSANGREQVLKTLLESVSRLRTDAYWNAIGRCVSRRQAERDLKRSPLLRVQGKTKGTYFVARRFLCQKG